MRAEWWETEQERYLAVESIHSFTYSTNKTWSCALAPGITNESQSLSSRSLQSRDRDRNTGRQRVLILCGTGWKRMQGIEVGAEVGHWRGGMLV